MRTQRMTILVTPEERSAISDRAEKLGVSSSEVLRLAFDAYDEADERRELETLADLLELTVKEMRESFALTHAEVAATLAELRASRANRIKEAA